MIQVDKTAIKANEILIKDLNRFSLIGLDYDKNAEIAEEGIRNALTFNRKLAAYGYSLDKDLLEKIAQMPKEKLGQAWNIMAQSIERVLGVESFRDRTLFYPNFPKEVMGKSEAELYLNSLVYYIGNAFGIDTQKGIVSQKCASELDFIYKDLVILSEGTLKDIRDLMDQRIHGLSMSRDKEEDLVWFANHYPSSFVACAIHNNKPYSSKENLVKTVSLLYDLGAKEYATCMIKDTPDVLRFIAHRSNQNMEEAHNRIDLAMQPREFVLSLNKEEKKVIKSMLNRCKNLYVDIWRHPGLWGKAMRYIGFIEKTPERVKGAFFNLANNRRVNEMGHPILTPSKRMKEAIQEIRAGDLDKALCLAENYPGFCAANIIELVKNCPTQLEAAKLSSGILEKCRNLPVLDLLKIKKRVLTINDNDFEYFKNRNGKVFVKENAKDFPDTYRYVLDAAITKILRESIAGTKALGKVYIDPELKSHIVPLRGERDASYNAPLTRYSEIPMTNNNLLCFGISWTQRADAIKDDVDMDLSVVAYDEDMNRIGHIYYGKLLTTWGCHSGDYTHGLGFDRSEPGSIEMIYCDKQKMKESGIRYLVPEISGFNREFQKEIDLRFLSFDRNYEMSVADCVPNNPEYTVLHNRSIGVSGAGRQAIPMVYDVENNKGVWLDEVYNNWSPFMNVHNSYGRKLLKATVEHALHQTYPTMQELFTEYAQAEKSPIVPMNEADTVFLAEQTKNQLGPDLDIKSGATVITSAQLDLISSEYLTRQSRPEREAERGQSASGSSPEEESVPCSIDSFLAQAEKLAKDFFTPSETIELRQDLSI